ncbi:MAG: hypothetical protein M3Z31_12235 [Pseudomonadota bacterium]|nr:hypothetical protein [Pseudomonadota bacterium]
MRAIGSPGDTAAAEWQHFRDVGNVTRATVVGVSKDNFQFGLQAYHREGNLSVVTYPGTYRPAPAPASGR